MVNYFGFLGFISAPLLGLVFQGAAALPPTSTWPLLFLCGVTGFTANVTMTRGFQLTEAATGALIRNSDVPIAFILQAIFLHEPVTSTAAAGAVCIFIASVGVAFEKRASAP